MAGEGYRFSFNFSKRNLLIGSCAAAVILVAAVELNPSAGQGSQPVVPVSIKTCANAASTPQFKQMLEELNIDAEWGQIPALQDSDEPPDQSGRSITVDNQDYTVFTTGTSHLVKIGKGTVGKICDFRMFGTRLGNDIPLGAPDPTEAQIEYALDHQPHADGLMVGNALLQVYDLTAVA